MDQRFKEAESMVEQRIIDSELCQDVRLQSIETMDSDMTQWRQEHEGIVDDIHLRLSKLDKYWTRSVFDAASPFTEPGLFPEPHFRSEQYATPTSTRYQAAWPIGHREELHHREGEYGSVTAYVHSLVTGMDDPPDTSVKIHGTAHDLITITIPLESYPNYPSLVLMVLILNFGSLVLRIIS